MALWQAFFMCSELQSPDACPLQKWEQKLLSIDGQNGQTWMRIAVNRYSNGAYDEALQAVRRAGTSPDSQLYWIESVDVLQKGFASTGLFTKHEELMIGLKKVYVANPILSGHTMMCDEQSKDSIEWAEACLAYGELTASMGRNRRTQELGKSIQVSALKSLGNHDRARSVENEFQRTDHKYNALFRQLEGQIEGDDPRFLDEYPHILVNALDKMRSESEMAGITYLAEEVDRLVLAQAATGCKPTNE